MPSRAWNGDCPSSMHPRHGRARVRRDAPGTATLWVSRPSPLPGSTSRIVRSLGPAQLDILRVRLIACERGQARCRRGKLNSRGRCWTTDTARLIESDGKIRWHGYAVPLLGSTRLAGWAVLRLPGTTKDEMGRHLATSQGI